MRRVVIVTTEAEARSRAREVGASMGYPKAAVRARDGQPFPEAVAWLQGDRSAPPPPTVVFWAPPEPARDDSGDWAVAVDGLEGQPEERPFETRFSDEPDGGPKR